MVAEKTCRSFDNVLTSILLIAGAGWMTFAPFWNKTIQSSDLVEWKTVVSQAPEWEHSGRSNTIMTFSVQGFANSVIVRDVALQAFHASDFLNSVTIGDTLWIGVYASSYRTRIQLGQNPEFIGGTAIEALTLRDVKRRYLELQALNFYKHKDSWLGTILGPFVIACVIWFWVKKRRLNDVPLRYALPIVGAVIIFVILYSRSFRYPG